MSAALLALLIVTPIALAAPAVSAATFRVLGEAQMRADLHAAFLVVGPAPLVWEATAESVVIERSYLDWTRVADRLSFAPPTEDWKTETITLTDATLVANGAREGGALLARGVADAVATTSAGLVLAHASDPRLDQGPPPDVENGEGDRMEIHEVLEGAFIATRVEEGVVEIRGDLTLDVRDLDYLARTATGERAFRTGTYETQDAVAARSERQEYQTVTLANAVLRFELAQPLDLYSDSAEVTLGGELLADGAAAPALLDAGLVLGVLDGQPLLLATAPAPAAAQGARAPATSGLALPAAVTAAALVAGALVLVALRRPRPDDVELALLAMTERRWGDALRRLQRALRQHPDDATLLLDRALCLEMMGRLRPAAKAYEATLRRAPRNAEAHFYLARTLAKLQDPEPGVVHLQTALELDPRLSEMARGDTAFRTLGVRR